MEKAEQAEQISNEWLKKIKEWAAKEYAPISREDTRKQGRQLVLASFVLILLSLKYFAPSTLNVSGFTITASSEYILIVVVGLVCLYLLLIYCIDLYADWKSPSAMSYQEIRNILVKEWNDLEDRARKLNQAIGQKKELREKKRRELGLAEEFPKLQVQKDSDAILEELDAYEEKRSERKKRMDAFNEYCENDGMANLSEDLTVIAFDHMPTYEKKFKDLLKVTKSVYRVRTCRFVLEVIFPVGIALFSFCTAIRYVCNI